MKKIILISWLGLISLVLLVMVMQLYLVYDLANFEYFYVMKLFGASGIAVIITLNIGALIIAFLALRIILGLENRKYRYLFIPILIIWGVVMLWVLEWTFMESPLSVRMSQIANDGNAFTELAVDSEVAFKKNKILSDTNNKKLQIMIERIRLNRPELFEQFDMLETIHKYAEQYNVNPELLFYWLYLGSYYGEAVSGKVPFYENMTAETLRDFIQIHLPSWFVESSVRQYLINTEFLQNIFGEYFGGKLRYAFQKATYDVSVEPYDTNIYSDIFAMIKISKNEFEDIFTSSNDNILNAQIKGAFNKLDKSAHFDPCFPIYKKEAYSSEYYNEYRYELKIFARSVFYKMLFDFDFATKVQALMAKNYSDGYVEELGRQTWEKVTTGQKMAMSAMLRDLYVPNIGKHSHNLYSLPELNCSSFIFVSQEAIKDKEILEEGLTTWRPKEYKNLWAGATTKLRVLSEVLEVVNGKPLPGVQPINTIKQSHDVVLMDKNN